MARFRPRNTRRVADDQPALKLWSRTLNRRTFLFLIPSALLFGCSHRDVKKGVRSTQRALSGDVAGAVGAYIPTSGVPEVDQLVRRQVSALIGKIQKYWKDRKVPTETEYVKYTDGYQSRAVVNFETGRIRVETRRQDDPRGALRRAIVATLLTPEDPTTVDLLSDREVKIGGQPFLYDLVVDHENQNIRWPWRAERYADHLLRTRYETSGSGRSRVHFVSFEMVREYQGRQQFKFQDSVIRNARRFNQPPALIYAIMEAESSFNPYAVSHVPAYGLMQIVPTTAGRDCHQLIYGRPGTPTREYLFVPENNIRMGTAYLHILDTRYLKMVQNPRSREYCVIAGYNTGSGNVLRAFHRDRNQAVARINAASPREVYEHLVRNLPYQETRNYLPKVVRFKSKYASLR